MDEERHIPDYEKWLNKELWTLIEACCLAVGVEPVNDGHTLALKEISDAVGPEDKRQKFNEIYATAKDATRTTNLPSYPPLDVLINGQPRRSWIKKTKVEPLIFIEWAVNRGIDIPRE